MEYQKISKPKNYDDAYSNYRFWQMQYESARLQGKENSIKPKLKKAIKFLVKFPEGVSK